MSVILFLRRLLIEIVKTKKIIGITIPAIYHDL
jgi:hypothetical protein